MRSFVLGVSFFLAAALLGCYYSDKFGALQLIHTQREPKDRSLRTEGGLLPPGFLNLRRTIGLDVRAAGITRSVSSIHLPPWYDYGRWGTPYFVNGTTDDAQTVRTTDLGKPNEDEEDTYALENFFNGMRNGLVFEMGVMDGYNHSVSKPLEILFDWRAIVVEANPRWAKEVPTSRPNALSINAAICNSPDTLHYAPGDHPETSKVRPTVGTIVEFASPEFITRFHQHLLKKLPDNSTSNELDPVKLAGLEQVACIPLGPLLGRLGVRHIDFFVLDCEGCEVETLNSIDFSRITIDVMVIETNKSQEFRAEIIRILTEIVGVYEVWAEEKGRNSWFKRKDFVPKLVATS